MDTIEKPKVLKLVEKQTHKSYGEREGGRHRMVLPPVTAQSLDDLITDYDFLVSEGYTVVEALSCLCYVKEYDDENKKS